MRTRFGKTDDVILEREIEKLKRKVDDFIWIVEDLQFRIKELEKFLNREWDEEIKNARGNL